MGCEVLQKVFVDKRKSVSLNRRELLWDPNSSVNSTYCEMNSWQLTFVTHSSHTVQLNTRTMWKWIQIVQFWVMTQRMNHPKTSPGQIHQSSQKPRWWGNQKTNNTQVTSGYNGRGTCVFHLVLWVCTDTHTHTQIQPKVYSRNLSDTFTLCIRNSVYVSALCCLLFKTYRFYKQNLHFRVDTHQPD